MIDITDMKNVKFWEALMSVPPGTSIVYHVGAHCGGAHRVDALKAYERKLVSLVQKRNGPDSFTYIAQKTRRSK